MFTYEFIFQIHNPFDRTESFRESTYIVVTKLGNKIAAAAFEEAMGKLYGSPASFEKAKENGKFRLVETKQKRVDVVIYTQ